MNKDIEDLKKLWQGQELEIPNSIEVVKQLNEIEKKNKKDRIFLACIFPSTIIPLALFIPILESPYYVASIIILSLAMLMILFLVFRNKFEKINSEEDFNNKVFLDQQIKKLRDKMKITSFYMWIYFLLIILGMNVNYIEAFSSFELHYRVIIHFSVSIVLFVFMFWMIDKKKEKNKKEIEPLIHQLESINDII